MFLIDYFLYIFAEFKQARIGPLQIVNQDDVPVERPVNKFKAYKVHIVQQSEKKIRLGYGFPDVLIKRRDTITGRVSVKFMGTSKLFKFVKKSRYLTRDP